MSKLYCNVYINIKIKKFTFQCNRDNLILLIFHLNRYFQN